MQQERQMSAMRVLDEAIRALTIGDAKQLSSLVAIAPAAVWPQAPGDSIQCMMRRKTLAALLRQTERNLRLLQPGAAIRVARRWSGYCSAEGSKSFTQERILHARKS
jgi:hypothetical protein